MWYLTQALFHTLNCKAHASFSLFKFLFGIIFFLDIYQNKFVANLFLFTLLVSCSLMWGEGCGGSLGKLLAVQAPAGWLHFSCCAREQGGVQVLSPRQNFWKLTVPGAFNPRNLAFLCKTNLLCNPGPSMTGSKPIATDTGFEWCG